MDCNIDYLNELVMISIDNLIEKFASKNAKKSNFLRVGSC